MKEYQIAVVAGDGIGPEVMAECKKVLNAAASLDGNFRFSFTDFPWGCEYYLKTGQMMPEDGIEILAEYDAILLGAVGYPGVPDNVSLRGLLIRIRHDFDQYINLRPVKLLKGAQCPLKDVKAEEIDMTFINNTEMPIYIAAFVENIPKPKKKGKYNVVQIDPDYVPAEQECKDVFGVTFEQGHNNFKIDASLLQNIVTENRDLPEAAARDLVISLITLKYTQSNSVCYVKDGQTVGVGAGQQSRIHCTRLAGQKADNWLLRQHPKVLALQFVEGIRRPDRDNAIDIYLSDECDDILADGAWQQTFAVRPEPLTAAEKKAWIAAQSGVSIGSDAFFPFGDNIERARKSGVQYVAEPGGSIRDDHVIETANRYHMVMAFTGMRLFHH